MASLQLPLLLLFFPAWLLLLAPGAQAVAVDCGAVFQSTLSQLASLTRECPEASFTDCCQIRDFVSPQQNGVFKIGDVCGSSTFHTPTKQYVSCDMETDGGGWIVIQRRLPNGTESFTRNWRDYEDGFGDLSGEFWLGLRNIHCLTARDDLELRIDMETEGGTAKTWTYQTFNVAGPEDGYRLSIGGGAGQGGDGMIYHNGMQFSTFDNDNDQSGGSCVNAQQGGWWYNACYRANLNGPHTILSLPGVDAKWARLIWIDNIDSDIYSYVPSVEMKICTKQCVSAGDSC